MRTDRKARIQEIGQELQKSSNSEALLIKELLALRADEVKDSLLVERGEDLVRAQGAAIAVDKLLVLVTRPTQPMQGGK